MKNLLYFLLALIAFGWVLIQTYYGLLGTEIGGSLPVIDILFDPDFAATWVDKWIPFIVIAGFALVNFLSKNIKILFFIVLLAVLIVYFLMEFGIIA